MTYELTPEEDATLSKAWEIANRIYGNRDSGAGEMDALALMNLLCVIRDPTGEDAKGHRAYAHKWTAPRKD